MRRVISRHARMDGDEGRNATGVRKVRYGGDEDAAIRTRPFRRAGGIRRRDGGIINVRFCNTMDVRTSPCSFPIARASRFLKGGGLEFKGMTPRSEEEKASTLMKRRKGERLICLKFVSLDCGPAGITTPRADASHA